MNKPLHYLAAAMLTLTSVVALAHDFTVGSAQDRPALDPRHARPRPRSPAAS